MNKKNILTTVLLLIITYEWVISAYLKNNKETSVQTEQNITFVSCYDGDTCTFDWSGIPPVFGEKLKVRLNGVDTPEIRGKCDSEKIKAEIARDWINNRLNLAEKIELKNITRGKYFRIIADIIADDKNVNQEIIDKNLGVPYQGEFRQGWCKESAFLFHTRTQ